MCAAGALRGAPPSTITTRRRARPSTRAALRPAAPPPTTSTSWICSSVVDISGRHELALDLVLDDVVVRAALEVEVREDPIEPRRQPPVRLADEAHRRRDEHHADE